MENKTGASSLKELSWFKRLLESLKNGWARIKKVIARLFGLAGVPPPATPIQKPAETGPQKTLSQDVNREPTQPIDQNQSPPILPTSKPVDIEPVINTQKLKSLIIQVQIRLRQFIDPMNELRRYEIECNANRVRVQHSLDQIGKKLRTLEKITEQHNNLSIELQHSLEETLQIIVDDKNMASNEKMTFDQQKEALKNLLEHPSITIGYMKS
jgi:hypothetical protein